MENTEAEVVHRPELTIKEILVTAEVPVSDVMFGFQTGGKKLMKKASFYVNTETWDCKGEVAGEIFANEEWWAEQCQRVSNRVREKITTLKV